MPAEPSGCRWCGVDLRDHFQRWDPVARWHGWTAPTDAQRLARMKTRRAAKPTPEQPPSALFAAIYTAGTTPPDEPLPSMEPR